MRYWLGWSNEASTLEIPRPRPQISRVFEVEASLFFRFRGFSRPRLAEKFEDFLRVYLEKPSKIKARLRSWMLRIFEDSSKNLEKMTYFVHKHRGFSRILEKSANLQVWGFFKGGLGSLEIRGWDLERLFLLRGFRGLPSKSSSSWGIFEAKPRKTLYFRGEAEGMIFEDFDHPNLDNFDKTAHAKSNIAKASPKCTEYILE